MRQATASAAVEHTAQYQASRLSNFWKVFMKPTSVHIGVWESLYRALEVFFCWWSCRQ